MNVFGNYKYRQLGISYMYLVSTSYKDVGKMFKMHVEFSVQYSMTMEMITTLNNVSNGRCGCG